MNLAEWLLEQITADEEVARAADRRIVALDEAVGYYDGDSITWRDWSEPVSPHVALGSVRDHIARWDPARVLAECAAKRAVVVKLASAHHASEVWLTGGREQILQITGEALRLLARPYRDREGYRLEWDVQ